MKLIIVSPEEAWVGTETIPLPERFHQLVDGLLHYADIRVCVNVDLHRESYIYAGQGRFVCGYCRQLRRYVERTSL